MRIVFTTILLGGVLGNSLPSTESVGEVFFGTMSFGRDLSVYAAVSAYEKLPHTARAVVVNGIDSIGHAIRWIQDFGAIVESSTGIYSYVHEFAIATYDRANEQSHRILDGMFREFEAAFPTQQGKIGDSLLDRIFALVWLIMVAKFVWAVATAPIRVVWWLKPSSKQVRTPPRKTTMGGCIETQPANTEPPRTVKKKVLISK